VTSPLHKSPIGWLELLRLRTLGKAPDVAGDTVIPTSDTTSFYGCDLQEVDAGSGGAGAFNLSIVRTFTVAGRVLGINISTQIGAAAGTFIRSRIFYQPNPSAASCCIGAQVFTPVVGGLFALGFVLPEPLVARAGAIFTFQSDGDAAGADHQLFSRILFEAYTGR